MKDGTKLTLAVGGGILATIGLFVSGAELVTRIIHQQFDYNSKPQIQLVAPPAPACKICHCHKTLCHRDCGEENMCALRCEGLCQKRGNDVGR